MAVNEEFWANTPAQTNYITTTGGATGWDHNTCTGSTYWYPWNYTYSPSITLTVTEALHLQKVASNDRRLRKILKKFTPYIAVELDLP